MGKSKRRNKKSYQQINDNDDNETKNNNSHKGQKAQGKQKHGQKGNNNGSKSKNKQKAKHNHSNDDYSFRQKLENNGEREIIEMATDGNCLFRSISHQLFNDYGQKHEHVRNEICDYLEDNEDDFKVYLLLEDSDNNDDVCDFKEYVNQMRTDGKWGGDVEIVCASRLYKRTVTIFSNVGAYNISIDNDEERSRPNILLSYHDNMHYNSVHDRQNSIHNNSHEDSLTQSSITKNNHLKKESRKKKKRYDLDEVKTDLRHEKNEHGCDKEPDKDNSQSSQKSNADSNVAAEAKKQNVPKRNDLCICGSGLRYKKCCLAKEKSRIRLEKFREKHGINDNKENKDEDTFRDSLELDGGFAVLNI